MTDTLLQISIIIGIVGNIIGISIAVFVIGNIEKRLIKIEKFIGKTNNLNRNR
jgi:ABC-type lipoprotein release transport system permease subunit